MHAINISTRQDRILELADKAISAGATELMIDVLTCGFPAIQILAEDRSVTLPLHIHRTMHLQGPEDKLSEISTKVLGVSVPEISSALKASSP